MRREQALESALRAWMLHLDTCKCNGCTKGRAALAMPREADPRNDATAIGIEYDILQEEATRLRAALVEAANAMDQAARGLRTTNVLRSRDLDSAARAAASAAGATVVEAVR